MDETIRLETGDGTWEVGGVDRKRGVWPEDLTAVWDDWGPKNANFTLKRKASEFHPDLFGLTPIVIEKGGGEWEGYIDQTTVADENTLGIECVGWPDYGGDDLEQKTYVHSDLSAWEDGRSFLSSDLTTRFRAAAQVQSGGGPLVLGWGKGTEANNNGFAGVILDLGPTSFAKRVTVTWENQGCAAATYTVDVRGGDTPGEVTTESIIQIDAASPTTSSATFATPRRYVLVALRRSAATFTETADRFVRITAAIVYADATYESGSVSVLKASDVLKDVLPRLCGQWSQDLTGIDATLLSLPHVAPTAPRSFRELAEALNALHGYVRKLERGRRFRFKAQPIKPTLSAGRWLGLDYRDTAKSATRDVINKAIAQGTNGAGEPLYVVRYAAQQPQAVSYEEAIFSPAPTNPTFAVDASGWVVSASAGGAITRDTVVFDTTPASGKWSGYGLSGYVEASFTGTFRRGVLYKLRLSAKAASSFGYGIFSFGDIAAGDLYTQVWAISAAWTSIYEFAWTPTQDRTTVKLRFQSLLSPSGPDINVDSLQLFQVAATALDKRGRVRAKVLSIPSQSVDPTVMQAFADVYLQSHMRTRARGELSVTGRALRDHTSGQPLEPFAIGEKTSELVCLLDETDPDNGNLGRNVPIASVRYSGNDETAQVSLDDSREDFEKVVSRYNLLAGGGV